MNAQKKNDELLAESAQEQQTSSTIDAQAEVNDRIARRAYELWEERGRGDGDALDNWLQAESEVRESMGEPGDEFGRQPMTASGASASR